MTEAQAFEILGIDDSKTYKQGYDRYRYLVKKLHHKGSDVEKFKELQLAWELIKDSLPKLPLVVLLTDGSSYKRWITDGTIHGDWIAYNKIGDAYHLVENYNHVNLYEIPKEDKVLQDDVNCNIRIVERYEWIDKYSKKPLWIVPIRKH